MPQNPIELPWVFKNVILQICSKVPRVQAYHSQIDHNEQAMAPKTSSNLFLETTHQFYLFQHMNHMAGPRGSIGPWLLHKLYGSVNITPILSTKVAINCSHHELHGGI